MIKTFKHSYHDCLEVTDVHCKINRMVENIQGTTISIKQPTSFKWLTTISQKVATYMSGGSKHCPAPQILMSHLTTLCHMMLQSWNQKSAQSLVKRDVVIIFMTQ